MTYQKCGHGKSLDDKCPACEKVSTMQENIFNELIDARILIQELAKYLAGQRQTNFPRAVKQLDGSVKYERSLTKPALLGKKIQTFWDKHDNTKHS